MNNEFYHSASTEPLIDAYWNGVGAEDCGVQADDNPFDLQTQAELYDSWHKGWLFGRELRKEEREMDAFGDEDIPF